MLNSKTLVSTVNGVENHFIPQGDTVEIKDYTNQIADYSQALLEKIGSAQSLEEVEFLLGELDRDLQGENAGNEYKIADNIRLANAIAFPRTIIRRNVESIVLPNGETPMSTQTNLGGNVIDPLGWSSKVIAPSKGYGILGKIEKLRRNHDDFNENLYREIISGRIRLISKGTAIEVSDTETAVMPLFAIEGKDIQELILPFSGSRNTNDVPTAKHKGINS